MYSFTSMTKTICCQLCGEEVERKSPNQRYCGKCSAYINRLGARQYWEKKKATTLPSSNKYDFAKITKYCAEHHITYGEAQKLGLLDNARFYRK